MEEEEGEKEREEAEKQQSRIKRTSECVNSRRFWRGVQGREGGSWSSPGFFLGGKVS